jgi:hypothetical protein
VLQARQLAPPRLDLAAVERFRRDDGEASPMVIRAFTGSGPNAEKSGENTLPFFKVPKRGDVELRNAAEQREDAIALADAERGFQNVGEAVGFGPEVA